MIFYVLNNLYYNFKITFTFVKVLFKYLKMVAFKDGTPREDGTPVLLFPDGRVFLNAGKPGPAVYFNSGFTKGYLGQIARILKAKKYILYTQGKNKTENGEQAPICILGESVLKTFNDALEEFNGLTLAKVEGDKFTLRYMTEEGIREFITQVCALTTLDANLPEKDEYTKYNIDPDFGKLKAVVKPSVVQTTTSAYKGFPKPASASASASASPSTKRWGDIPIDEEKKGPVLSAESLTKIEVRVANVSLKKETVTTLESKLVELLAKQKSELEALQAELTVSKEQVTKAEKLLEATRNNEIAKAVAEEAAQALAAAGDSE